MLLPARTLELGPEGLEDWVVLDELTHQALLMLYAGAGSASDRLLNTEMVETGWGR